MTEFKRTSEELEKIAELVESIEHDAMIPPPMKLLELQTAKERMEGELAAKVTRFEKRLGEKDPVSGVARYGENMRMKVIDLMAKYQAIGQRLVPVEARLAAEVAHYNAHEAVILEEGRQAERERVLDEEVRLRGVLIREQEEKRKEATVAAILEQKQLRLAEEANRSRQERKLALEEEERQRVEDKARRDQEAEELTRSVPVGAAGVEDGLRQIDEACGSGGNLAENMAQKKAAVQALMQILHNVAFNPEDPRFRRIRLDNESFQRTVGCFEGGIQILLSSGFKMQVEEGQTVLVMHEPDLAEDMDGWSVWYANITAAAERLKVELDERF